MLHMLPTSYARNLILQPKNGLVHQVLFVIAFCLVLQVLDLMPQADSITKLASRCSYCEGRGSPESGPLLSQVPIRKLQNHASVL